MNIRLTKHEQQGVMAIIALRAIVGVTENEENALTIWLSMSEEEQGLTLFFANVLFGLEV